MDEELKKLIEDLAAETRRRFEEAAGTASETRRYVEDLAVETRRRFEEASLETQRRFEEAARTAAETRRYVEETATETRRHVEETATETRRWFEVVAERLESKIDTVAEGVIAVNQRVDRLDAKVDRLSADIAAEFNDVRSMIKFSHHELDRRLRSLEDVVSDLQTRVERLESSTH